MFCHYCKFYQEVPSKLRRVERRNGKAFYYRHCIKIGVEVQSDDPICEEFRPAKYFWCERDENWMFVVACLNRECKCSQKEEVLDAIRGFDIGEEFNMKPKLVIKKAEKTKLKLKKTPVLKLKLKPKKVIQLKLKKSPLIRKIK